MNSTPRSPRRGGLRVDLRPWEDDFHAMVPLPLTIVVGKSPQGEQFNEELSRARCHVLAQKHRGPIGTTLR